MDTLVVVEFPLVTIADGHSNLPQALEQIGDAVVVEDGLMEILELVFFVLEQGLNFLVGQDGLEGLTDLTLDADGNVFLDEVLDHCEVVAMVLRVVPQVVHFFVDPPHFFFETFDVLLFVLAIVDLLLVAHESLFVISERASALVHKFLDALDSLVKFEHFEFVFGMLLAVVADVRDQLPLVFVVVLEKAVLPLQLPLGMGHEVVVQLLEDVVEIVLGIFVLLDFEFHVFLVLLNYSLLPN